MMPWRDAISTTVRADDDSREFIRLICSDPNLDYRLSRLLALFAPPPPSSVGDYAHHDGWR